MRRIVIAAFLIVGVACSSTPPDTSPAATQSAPQGPTPAADSPTGAAAPSPSPAATPAPTSSAPAAPAFREITLPAGTVIAVTLQTPVASDQSKVEDRVEGRVTKPVMIDGAEAIPADALVTGTVTNAEPSGRVKGRARIAFRFDRLSASDESYVIRTSPIAREARATKGEDAKKIGIGAGAGAAVGAILGGKKGALVGGAVGAGAGTGVVAATPGEEVRLGRGASVTVRLREPLTVRVRR